MTGWTLLLAALTAPVLVWQWDPQRGLGERWRQWRSKRMRRDVMDEFETQEAVDTFRSMRRADLQTGEQE